MSLSRSEIVLSCFLHRFVVHATTAAVHKRTVRKKAAWVQKKNVFTGIGYS